MFDAAFDVSSISGETVDVCSICNAKLVVKSMPDATVDVSSMSGATVDDVIISDVEDDVHTV